jgi:hypothetical protein
MAEHVEVEMISHEESWEIFDENAQRLLGVSGEEFVRAWESGGYQPVTSTKVMQVVMLMPSGR